MINYPREQTYKKHLKSELKMNKICNLEPFSYTVAFAQILYLRSTKASIIATCHVAVILIIALLISFIIKSFKVPENLNLSITLFL